MVASARGRGRRPTNSPYANRNRAAPTEIEEKSSRDMEQSEIMDMNMNMEREEKENNDARTTTTTSRSDALMEALLRALTEKEFRVPGEHPVFSGKPDDVESFIVSMELAHRKETRKIGDNPNFVSKLAPYFSPALGARSAFEIWAEAKSQAGESMTWAGVKDHLRDTYGQCDDRHKRYQEFHAVKQTGTVTEYITRRKRAAMLMGSDITENTRFCAFVAGLKPEIATYVRLQKAETLEEAQQFALAYETNGGKGNKREGPQRKHQLEQSGSSSAGERTKRSRGRKKLNDEQRAAATELKGLRQGACFRCGAKGHFSNKCQAEQGDVDRYRARVDALKAKIKGQ